MNEYWKSSGGSAYAYVVNSKNETIVKEYLIYQTVCTTHENSNKGLQIFEQTSVLHQARVRKKREMAVSEGKENKNRLEREQ